MADLNKLVEEIGGLSLIEAAELVYFTSTTPA